MIYSINKLKFEKNEKISANENKIVLTTDGILF